MIERGSDDDDCDDVGRHDNDDLIEGENDEESEKGSGIVELSSGVEWSEGSKVGS